MKVSIRSLHILRQLRQLTHADADLLSAWTRTAAPITDPIEATDDLASLRFPRKRADKSQHPCLKLIKAMREVGVGGGRSYIGAELEVAGTSPSPVRLWLPFHLLLSRVVPCCDGAPIE